MEGTGCSDLGEICNIYYVGDKSMLTKTKILMYVSVISPTNFTNIHLPSPTYIELYKFFINIVHQHQNSQQTYQVKKCTNGDHMSKYPFLVELFLMEPHLSTKILLSNLILCATICYDLSCRGMTSYYMIHRSCHLFNKFC